MFTFSKYHHLLKILTFQNNLTQKGEYNCRHVPPASSTHRHTLQMSPFLHMHTHKRLSLSHTLTYFPTYPHTVCTVPSGLINLLWVNYVSCPLPGCPGQSQHVISPTFMNRGQQPTRGSWEAGGCWTLALLQVTGGLFRLGSIVKRSATMAKSFIVKWHSWTLKERGTFLGGKNLTLKCSRVLNSLYFLNCKGWNWPFPHMTTTAGTVYSLNEPLWLVTTCHFTITLFSRV